MLESILEFLYVSTLGCFFHFIYDILGHIKIFSVIGAVNESCWEHLKLGVVPFLTWSPIALYFFGTKILYFPYAAAIITYKLTIITIYYCQKAIMGSSKLVMDIISFYISVLTGMLVKDKLFEMELSSNLELIGKIAWAVLLFNLYFFTYHPIKIFLLIDEKAENYGIDAHEFRCMNKKIGLNWEHMKYHLTGKEHDHLHEHNHDHEHDHNHDHDHDHEHEHEHEH